MLTDMLIYHSAMLVGERLENAEEVKRLLQNGTAVLDVFVICINPDSTNLMDIFHSLQILKRMCERKKYVVIGLSGSYDDALDVVRRIIENYVRSGKSLTHFRNHYLKQVKLRGYL